jgi:hypothetical protein
MQMSARYANIHVRRAPRARKLNQQGYVLCIAYRGPSKVSARHSYNNEEAGTMINAGLIRVCFTLGLQWIGQQPPLRGESAATACNRGATSAHPATPF